ncbi:heavy metal-binding domain-containing protein, partial [Streptomyces beijiangensis]
MYAARRLALTRAVAECRALGGDGIVGVKLRIGEFPAGGLEFTALGTAVRAHSRIRPRQPFTSHLSGQDFAKLIHAGWVPTGLAFGIAVASRHDDWRTSRRITWTAGNQEVDGYTQLISLVR